MMEGNEAYDLSIERAFDTEALSSFFCGVREIDLLIHKKEGGLRSFISEFPCDFYIIKFQDSIAALLVLSDRSITIGQENYNSLEIEFVAVKQDFRGKGIGREILKITEQNARDSDYLFLTTAAFVNKRYNACGFYEKSGFVKNGRKVGNTIPMYKYLEPVV